MPQNADDPIVNAVVSQDGSRFVRFILKAALDNTTANLPSEYTAEAQALFANIVMNDILNWWNTDLPETATDAQNHMDEIINTKPALPSQILALAYHARGLANRALGDPDGALDDFRQAITQDPNFARPHAQVGNQKALNNLIDPKNDNPHGDFTNARKLAANYPAIGYFDWGEGRLYFIEAALGTEPWSKAIACLQMSVDELSTVWYNRLYLAAAQNNSSDPMVRAKAPGTVKDFTTIFGQNALNTAKLVLAKPGASAPVNKARQIVLNFLNTQPASS